METPQGYIRIHTREERLGPHKTRRVWWWEYYTPKGVSRAKSTKTYTSKDSIRSSLKKLLEELHPDTEIRWDEEAYNPNGVPGKGQSPIVLLGVFKNPDTNSRVKVYETRGTRGEIVRWWYRNLQRRVIPNGRWAQWHKVD